VRDLKAKGVTFAELDASSFAGQPGATDGHITDFGSVKPAWFNDTEGNILALKELVSAQA